MNAWIAGIATRYQLRTASHAGVISEAGTAAAGPAGSPTTSGPMGLARRSRAVAARRSRAQQPELQARGAPG